MCIYRVCVCECVWVIQNSGSGSSRGVTLPSKDLKYAGIETGDELEITVSKRGKTTEAETLDVVEAAKKILAEYTQDFNNLAKR